MSFLKTAVTAVTATIVVAGGGWTLYRTTRLLEAQRDLALAARQRADLEIEIAENQLVQAKAEARLRVTELQQLETVRHERHVIEMERLRQISAVQEARHSQLMEQFNDPKLSAAELSDLAREFLDNLKAAPETVGGTT